MTRKRVLFHVQHLLGIGHWRRAMALARAMDEAGLAVTVLSGGPAEDEAAAPGQVEIVQLPPARAVDASFAAIIDGDGCAIDDVFKSRRRDLVLAALRRVRPHIVLIESFPFGRRAFRFELLPLIAAAREAAARPAILASIRDVLVAKNDPARAAEIVAQVRRDFDRVLVHGDRDLIALDASFPSAAAIAAKLIYTGYVMAAPGSDDGIAGTGEVIVSAGGGAVGMALLRAALAARPLSPLAAAPWRLLAGPHLPTADFEALGAALPPGVVLERFRPDFPAMLSRCVLSISQGGYNTTLDLLRSRARAIVVPFAAAGETEQTLRSTLLARRGAFRLLGEGDLDGESLAAAIAARMAEAAPLSITMQRDGAAASARIIAEIAVGNRAARV